MHTARRNRYGTGRPGFEAGRALVTLLGGAALIVAAFLHWTRDTGAVNITDHSLVGNDFTTSLDFVNTIGALTTLLGLLSMIGVVERSGWLRRVTGVLGIALFVLFAVQVHRSSDHSLQTGAWLALAGGIAVLTGGLLTPRIPGKATTA